MPNTEESITKVPSENVLGHSIMHTMLVDRAGNFALHPPFLTIFSRVVCVAQLFIITPPTRLVPFQHAVYSISTVVSKHGKNRSHGYDLRLFAICVLSAKSITLLFLAICRAIV